MLVTKLLLKMRFVASYKKVSIYKYSYFFDILKS